MAPICSNDFSGCRRCAAAPCNVNATSITFGGGKVIAHNRRWISGLRSLADFGTATGLCPQTCETRGRNDSNFENRHRVRLRGHCIWRWRVPVWRALFSVAARTYAECAPSAPSEQLGKIVRAHTGHNSKFRQTEIIRQIVSNIIKHPPETITRQPPR